MHHKPKNNSVFGIHAIKEAILAGKPIDKVFIKKGLKGELFSELFQLIREHKVVFQYVPIEKLNRLTKGNHQGVVAFISPIDFQEIEQIIPFVFENGKTPLVLILDEVSDVRNFGAIARTAECAGVDAIIIPSKGSARIGPDAIKTSAGALNIIPVCKTDDLPETIKFLKNSGLQIIAADEKSDTSYYEINFKTPTALILGSEERGIHPANVRYADEIVKIPMTGNIQSLNVSVANGILLFEAVKQRLA